MWISFGPFVRANSSTQSITLELLYGFLRAVFIIMCLLLGEKLVIQIMSVFLLFRYANRSLIKKFERVHSAHDFHTKAFESRIAEQKLNVKILATLYLNSSDIGRIDTMNDGEYSVRQKAKSNSTLDPSAFAKKVFHGAKK